MVLIPKQNKKAILQYIFKEGVIVCAKDHRKPKHDDIEVPNIHVMMVCKSLTSRGYLTHTFNWQWHYYYLTDEGIAYLREQLHLPAQVAPLTLTKQRTARPMMSSGGGEGGKGKGWGKGGGKGKWDDDQKPSFGGKGFGRGRGYGGKGKGKGGDESWGGETQE
uniref:Plectin/eS10 N-terminal domain-containing protein n=1 Tax=Oxyrrhis marina TaxID=2969 RepID=A0A7S3XGC3_OXYMA|mmetsp:Transcript_22134/g.53918  ORF Transcript_22134/g.53918 Transcript_22134/m.53918 type:complete len:163 (+) Transcript_22134:43-531(+)